MVSVAHPGETSIAGSVGKPLSKLEVKLAGEGEVGELLVHGPNVMEGYYRNQAATDAVLKDGWLHTGDLGRFDSEGRLYIVGRAKDVIVDAGGNNIYIDEVEEVIRAQIRHQRDGGGRDEAGRRRAACRAGGSGLWARHQPAHPRGSAAHAFRESQRRR